MKVGCVQTLQFLNLVAYYSNPYQRLVATTRRPQELLKGHVNISLLRMRWNNLNRNLRSIDSSDYPLPISQNMCYLVDGSSTRVRLQEGCSRVLRILHTLPVTSGSLKDPTLFAMNI